MGLIGRLRAGTLLGRAGRDATYLSLGAAAAQVIVLLGRVVLARMYDTTQFGQFNIAVAIGSILLMKGFMEQQGIILAPFDLSVWAIPTAIFAFLIHGFRLWRQDRKLRQRGGAA